MRELIKADSTHADFVSLVQLLDADLAVRDGTLHTFYHQYNTISDIRYVVLAYEQQLPVGCGAIKEFDDRTMEVKRMYVVPECRNKGVATSILRELENWTRELGYERCILETGKGQPEAIALYGRNGYRMIPNYGQYTNVDNSVCFEKRLA
jgi:putative acetyltransferase